MATLGPVSDDQANMLEDLTDKIFQNNEPPRAIEDALDNLDVTKEPPGRPEPHHEHGDKRWDGGGDDKLWDMGSKDEPRYDRSRDEGHADRSRPESHDGEREPWSPAGIDLDASFDFSKWSDQGFGGIDKSDHFGGPNSPAPDYFRDGGKGGDFPEQGCFGPIQAPIGEGSFDYTMPQDMTNCW